MNFSSSRNYFDVTQSASTLILILSLSLSFSYSLAIIWSLSLRFNSIFQSYSHQISLGSIDFVQSVWSCRFCLCCYPRPGPVHQGCENLRRPGSGNQTAQHTATDIPDPTGQRSPSCGATEYQQP